MTARVLPTLSSSNSRPGVTVVAALVVLALSVAVFAKDPGRYHAMLASGYLALLAWLAVHDIRTLRAPNIVVIPAAATAVVLSIPLGIADFTQAIAGGLVAFVLLFAVAVIGRGAMGFGDVKVGAIAGLAAGLNAVFMMFVLTFAMGAAFAGAMLVARARRRRDVVAFTPFLAIAVAICLVTGGSYLTG